MNPGRSGGTEWFRGLLSRHASSKRVCGFLVLVSKDGTTQAFAATARGDAGQTIAPNSLVRITSWTKLIVAAAALALPERRRLELDDPIDRFMPATAAVRQRSTVSDLRASIGGRGLGPHRARVGI
jgi:CubicO group peptidase (beta-lactamase class C family)